LSLLISALKHSAYFCGKLFRNLVGFLLAKPEIVRNDELRLQLAIRASRMAKEENVFAFCRPAVSFSNIAGD
jgi:hypothetical protein